MGFRTDWYKEITSFRHSFVDVIGVGCGGGL